MSANWQNSKFVKEQRDFVKDILKKKKDLERIKRKRWNLEKEKNELRLKFPQQEIAGRIETLNKTIDKINKEIEKS